MSRPLYVYDNWSSYDELSDAVPLTEELALFQLDQVRRLMGRCVKFDAYLMDAYWYDPDGGYLTWRADRWPNGPDRWLSDCAEAGLLPGLWFPANTCFTLNPPASWQDSLAADGWGFCCFEGGFLAGFMDVLRHWYGRGVRVFKFDFAEFNAASEATKLTMLPSEIRARNVEAYRNALLAFKAECPQAYLLGYNGFEEAEFMPWTDRPVRRVIDPAWLDVFDTIYCGDPRPADLPQANLWRTLDIYADHEVRYLNLGGLPLERIDNCALMLGGTDTCYRRGSAEWQTTWLLSYARGGNVHVTMGDLSAITNSYAAWISDAQTMYEYADKPAWIGGIPGKGEVYGYDSGDMKTYVNPGMTSQTLELEDFHLREGWVYYYDGASLNADGKVVLAPGGVLAFGADRMQLPATTTDNVAAPVEWTFGDKAVSGVVNAPAGELHFGFRQFDGKELAVRTTTGSGPGTPPLGSVLQLSAYDAGGYPLPVELQHDRVMWSGISWAYGIIRLTEPAQIRLEMLTTDPAVKGLEPFAYFFTSISG